MKKLNKLLVLLPFLLISPLTFSNGWIGSNISGVIKNGKSLLSHDEMIGSVEGAYDINSYLYIKNKINMFSNNKWTNLNTVGVKIQSGQFTEYSEISYDWSFSHFNYDVGVNFNLKKGIYPFLEIDDFLDGNDLSLFLGSKINLSKHIYLKVSYEITNIRKEKGQDRYNIGLYYTF